MVTMAAKGSTMEDALAAAEIGKTEGMEMETVDSMAMAVEGGITSSFLFVGILLSHVCTVS